MKKPFLSIVTCALNSKEDFLLTAASLPSILPDWIEWVAVDGVSNDGTVEELNNEKRLRSSISEPDAGVYDAYNKAWKSCQGKYIWFLNCGDTASLEAIRIIESIMNCENNPNTPEEVHCFGVSMLAKDKVWYPEPGALPRGMSVPTPGVLFPKKGLEMIGGFNDRLKVAADYELLLKLYLSHLPFRSHEEVLTAYKGDGISTEYATLGFFEECVIQLKLKSITVDEVMLRSARYAVNTINPENIKYKRWNLAIKLGKKFLY